MAALRLREVPRRRRRAPHLDAVGRRGHGDRPHLQAGVREGDALARARRGARTSPGTCSTRLETPSHDRYEVLFEAVRQGADEAELCRRTGIDPWFMAEIAELARGHDPEAGLERTFKAVDTCAAEFEAETPYYYSGWERRAVHEVRLTGPPRGGDPRLRAQPHRPGHRVRLLLRARGDDRARVRPRRGDDQLQPGDGLHRLRHLRPALLRAAHPRGRARRARARAPRGGDRPVRRPDAAEAGARAGRRRRAAARHAGRLDPPGRGPPELQRAARRARAAQPAVRHRVGPRRGARARRRAWATRCWCGRRTCSAGGRWRSATRPTASPTTCGGSAATCPGSGEIFLDRFLENAIEIDVDALCDGQEVRIGAIMQHVEEAGVHSGDSACVIPAMSLGPAHAAPGRAGHRGDRAAARGDRPDQHPVRRLRRRGAVRDRGQPARLAHRAVRVEGHRPAAGQGGLPADAGRAPARPRPAAAAPAAARVGQGGGAAVRALPGARTRCSAPR